MMIRKKSLLQSTATTVEQLIKELTNLKTSEANFLFLEDSDTPARVMVELIENEDTEDGSVTHDIRLTDCTL